MSQVKNPVLAPPRFVNAPAMLMAGLNERYHCENIAAIPQQWARFGPYLGALPDQVPFIAYAAMHNPDDSGNFDYMTCMEVKSFDQTPAELARLRIPAARYAVFTHSGHISGIQGTFRAIWSDWFPASGHAPAETPQLERYDDRFDADTGKGDVEIWIPIKT